MAKSYQIGYDKTYCYEDSTVLKNKLDIRDKEKLSNIEGEVTFHRSIQIQDKPVKGNLDYLHLKDIHKALFNDIYSWAGELRMVDIAKDNMFCKPAFLESYGEDFFKGIKKNNYCIGTDRNVFAEKAAELTGDLNALHPFREGNGRSQRMFLRYLANVAGYKMEFSNVPHEEIIKASIESMQCDYTRYTKIYKENITPLSYLEQKEFINSIAADNSSIIEEFVKYESKSIQKEIKNAGFKATDKLITDIKTLNNSFGKLHSIKEIKQLYDHKKELDSEQKEIVEKTANDFKSQEKLKIQEFELER